MSAISLFLSYRIESSPFPHPFLSSLLIVYEGADDSIATPMDSCCSLENCCVDSDDLAKLAAVAANNTTSPQEEEEEAVEQLVVDDHEGEDLNGDKCCYELDASQDSTDVQLSSSHEDHAIESQLRIRRRQHEQQRQQLNQDCRRVVSETGKAAFVPFSEETMFCDSNENGLGHAVDGAAGVGVGHVDTSSPVSSDSWMNYSSHSSDDYSFMMESGHGGGSVVSGGAGGVGKGNGDSAELRRHRGSGGSLDSGASIVPKNRRKRDSFVFRKGGQRSIDEGDSVHVVEHEDATGAEGDGSSCDHDEEEEEDDDDDNDDDEGDNESVDETLAHLQINQPKRLRGKEPTPVTSIGGGCGGSASAPAGGGGGVLTSGGRKSVSSSRRSSTNAQQLVDIRIIDFAHTAFVKKSAASPSALTMPPPPPLNAAKPEAAAAVHKGPDCGFLTGVDSLKRLLQEILPGDGGVVDTSTHANLNMVE